MTPEERTELVASIAQALKESHIAPAHQLTEDEARWVRLAIEAEARKIKFRDAVIEKTLAGLAWAAIVGIAYLVVDFFRNHGLKV